MNNSRGCLLVHSCLQNMIIFHSDNNDRRAFKARTMDFRSFQNVKQIQMKQKKILFLLRVEVICSLWCTKCACNHNCVIERNQRDRESESYNIHFWPSMPRETVLASWCWKKDDEREKNGEHACVLRTLLIIWEIHLMSFLLRAGWEQYFSHIHEIWSHYKLSLTKRSKNAVRSYCLECLLVSWQTHGNNLTPEMYTPGHETVQQWVILTLGPECLCELKQQDVTCLTRGLLGLFRVTGRQTLPGLLCPGLFPVPVLLS